MPEKRVRLSQCMIVKNEEKNIKRALSWGQSVMWEQIVVDTGSTDRTVEIARQMGAKICVFPWINDFAAAKNYAIEQCSGDWIALLDADEYMLPEDVKKLIPIIDDLHKRKLDGLSTAWRQLDDQGKMFASGTQVRFFCNTPDIRYRRRIHEQLESVSGRTLHLGDGVRELSIFHTGYQSADMKGKKGSSRNKRLIEEELKENPADYEMMGYMGDEYRLENDQKNAEVWYRHSMEYMPSQLKENDQRSAVTFTNLLIILGEREDTSWEQAKDIYERAVGLLPWEADLDYGAGYFLAVKGRNEEAVFYLEKALKKLDRYGSNNKAMLVSGNLFDVYKLLSRCCYESGQGEKGSVYAVNCLKNDPYDMAVLSGLLKSLLPGECQGLHGEYEAVGQFLGTIYDLLALKDRLFVMKTAGVSGLEGFAKFIMGTWFTAEEKQLLGI